MEFLTISYNPIHTLIHEFPDKVSSNDYIGQLNRGDFICYLSRMLLMRSVYI